MKNVKLLKYDGDKVEESDIERLYYFNSKD